MDKISSSGSADFEDFEDEDDLWRAEEAAADEEHRLTEEALAEEAAAEELMFEDADEEPREELAEELLEEDEVEDWMGDANEEWVDGHHQLLEQLEQFVEEEHFEDPLESLGQQAYDMVESDDDISLGTDFDVNQTDPIPDFNDWGSDPGGVAKAASLCLTLKCKKSWEVPKMPLGQSELWQFGPNGPPMNVMDACSASNMLWIANQQDLFGFSLTGLEAQIQDQNLRNQVLIAHLPSLSGQVNRIRCGQLGRQPVVAAVDAAGGVLVAPSLVNAKLPPIKLLNPGVGEQGVSTWGIGLPPHDEGKETGPLLVSANDHCLKAWWLFDSPSPGQASRAAGHGAGYGGGDNREERRPRSSWYLQQVKGQGEKAPLLLHRFAENLPCIDIVGQLAIVASLGGEVSVLNVVPPSSMESPDLAAFQDHDVQVVEAPRLDEQLCCTTPPRWPCPWEDPRIVRCFAHAESRRVWNVCWIPLRSIRTVSTVPGASNPSEGVEEDTVEWTSNSGAALPAEIIRGVLSLLGPQELLQRVQILSSQHAQLAREQVHSSKRTELMALVFSENTVWLTDGCLNMRCKQTLPFNGAFAHIVPMPGLSSVIVSTKMDSTNYPLWAVSLVRRQRSLRFELRVTHLDTVETNLRDLPWPRNIIVGMAGSRDRLLILYSSCRLVCYQLSLEDRRRDEELQAEAGTKDLAS
ncbi:unnamed protein product [Durusdinium trenchii]|uniref:F-box domain-containing protein n=1 Tax=Durusdinium trenchii TaxID=1381693 RepID=A0ABP0NMZ0_9DINO